MIRGSIVNGKVKEVEAKQAIVSLADQVEAVLKSSEISVDHVDDARNVLAVDEEIEVKIVSVDRKSRNIAVSIKAKDIQEEEDAVKEHREKESDVNPTTLGDLIKQKMDSDIDTESETSSEPEDKS